ncbi:transposase [Xanthomonas oryzae pv. oryzicola]|nr:transposase [Xanthomonas oryzae pv. oryzicola]AKN98820.1 transposase [Xanthomonas oryzae pv. oryzicola]AKO17777.1 transposase [Xanthomonas oryzae pv. oryzicola]
MLELPVFITLRPGFWQFSPMRTRRSAAEQLHADELFRSRLENQIDLRHPLVQLSHRLPWSALEQVLSPRLPATTSTGGRPALPVRLIAGLLYLKHAYDLSDEAVCERWLENPYWQFFTGEVVFQTCLPCDPSSLTRWRQRLGEAGMEELLAHTICNASWPSRNRRYVSASVSGWSAHNGC